MSDYLLDVQGLTLGRQPPGASRPLVRELDLRLEAGGALGLVGESGSGKTLSVLSLAGLLPPGLVATARHATFAGQPLFGLPPAQLRALRGRGIAYVFQDPLSALNPVLSIGRQIGEAVRQRGPASRSDIEQQVVTLLQRVGLPEPGRRLRQFPHQLSGGQRQRVCIAMALACAPRLLILDEPTTALDVTVQAAIVELVLGLRAETGLTLIWVSHDLPLLARIADTLLVLRDGEQVESGPAAQLFRAPAHPYTRELLACARGEAAPMRAQAS